MKRRGFLMGMGGAIGASPLAKLFAGVAGSGVTPEQFEPTQPVDAHGTRCTINGHPFHVLSVSGPSGSVEVNVTSFDDPMPVFRADYGDVDVCCYPSAGVLTICNEAHISGRAVELVFYFGDDETSMACEAVISNVAITADPYENLKADISFRMCGPVVMSGY